MEDSPEPSPGRSRRQKIDKTGRLSAFEKLKALKGSKNKYEVDNIDNVYEIVDEKSYSRKVLDRQNDDWIVDDGNSGYIEDGREIFDDDLDEESIEKAKKENVSGPRKKAKDQAKKKGNIGSMLMNMSKAKEKEDTEDSGFLGELLSELKSSKPVEKVTVPDHVKNKFVKKSHPIKTDTNQPEKRRNEDVDDSEDLFQSRKHVQKKQKLSDSSVPEKAPSSVASLFNRPQSDSQKIDDGPTTVKLNQTKPKDNKPKDEDFEDIDMNFDEPMETEAKPEAPSASQKIDNPDEDNQFLDDIALSNVDFDNMEMDTKDVKVQPQSQCKQLAEETDNLQDFCKAWDDDFTQMGTSTVQNDDKPNLPLPITTNEKNEKMLKFFWWDAQEDPFRQPGVVYLYGKVYYEKTKQYVSCCVVVKNIPKRIFVLPREFKKTNSNAESEESEEVSMEDVFNEFTKLTRAKGIKEFRSRPVTKKYAFEREGTPLSCEYLEVKYAANYPTIEENYSGASIEAVFGTTVNALELFLIERKIKGPCWLDIKFPVPVTTSCSWSKLQVNCLKMENISVNPNNQSMSLPPMVAMTLNVRTALNTKAQHNEVVMVAVLVHREFSIDKAPPKPPFEQHFCLVSHPQDTPFPLYSRDMLTKNKHTNIIVCEKEANLLEELLSLFEKIDPDLLVGYDCGFQLDVLTHRINILKTSNWSRIGKLKRQYFPNFKSKPNLSTLFCGRPICDIQHSAKELNLKLRTYDLQSLCVSILNKNENECKEIKPSETVIFYNTPEKLETLVSLTMSEALNSLMLMIELNVMPLALQITCIAGNVLSRTLTAGRAERNEFLLLHSFHQRDYITPDKRNMRKNKNADETSGRKKPAYSGGLVLDPKKGFYDKFILLMDFNSLYPSIIQEYNLCFTTVPGAAYADLDDLVVPEPGLEPGVVPTEIRKLVESRVAVKQLMKAPNLSPELKMQYNIRQLALKLTANSMYGCLGAVHCRFYAKGLAALVTSNDFIGNNVMEMGSKMCTTEKWWT